MSTKTKREYFPIFCKIAHAESGCVHGCRIELIDDSRGRFNNIVLSPECRADLEQCLDPKRKKESA
jgi:hypothetical protein